MSSLIGVIGNNNMSYFKHHSIIITSFKKDAIEKARIRAMKDFGKLVTPMRESAVNNWYSFAILPDCSKEGWGESNMFDNARDRMHGWLIKQRYEDGSSPYDAVEVWFDEEDRTGSKIIN